MNLKQMILTISTFASVGFADGAKPIDCVILGKADPAPTEKVLTIEEFVDFQCKFCARGANTMKLALQDYPNRIRLVLRNLPLKTHPLATTAAKAFIAVYLQNASLANAYQEKLFSHQDKFNAEGEQYLYDLGDKLGVDVTQMKSDMGSDTVAKILANDLQAAESHDFKGTPSFVIGAESFSGALPYDQMKTIIDKELGN